MPTVIPVVLGLISASHTDTNETAPTLSLPRFVREMETDRPDFTEGTATIEPGRFQLEFGYTLTHNNDDFTDHALGESLLRIGLADRLELRLGWDGYGITRYDHNDDESGIRDTSLGFKYAILRDHPETPDISLIASLTFPTGARNQRADGIEGDLALALAMDLPRNLSLGMNVGAAYTSEDDDHDFEAFFSTALGFDIAEKLGGYIEYFGIMPEFSWHDDTHYLNTGLTYALTPDLQLDARIGMGLNTDADDVFFGIGFSFRW